MSSAQWLKAPPDLLAALERFGATETRVITQFNELIAQAQRGALSDADFATRVERDILAPWRDAMSAIQAPPWRPEQRLSLGPFLHYAKARQRKEVEQAAAQSGSSKPATESSAP